MSTEGICAINHFLARANVTLFWWWNKLLPEISCIAVALINLLFTSVCFPPFSCFKAVNPLTTQSHLLLLAIRHHGLTGWFISLGDSNTGCKSSICTSCLSFRFRTPSLITHTHTHTRRACTHLIRDAQIPFLRKHTHPLHTQRSNS